MTKNISPFLPTFSVTPRSPLPPPKPTPLSKVRPSSQRLGSIVASQQENSSLLTRVGLAALGVLALGTIGYLLSRYGQNFPLPPPKNHKEQNPDICIFTSYTTNDPERLEMSRFVATNHQKYAQVYGYDYRAFEENLAPGSLPYWSKIGGMIKYLKGEVSTCPNPKWIVWIDDDALFTNPNIQVKAVIRDQIQRSLASKPHVIVTKDAVSDLGWTTSLNTGVLFVRKSKESLRVMQQLFAMRFDSKYNCPEQKGCLHEQEAFHDLLQRKLMKEVKIIEQRGRYGINTFARYDYHLDLLRKMFLDYSEDPEKNRWQLGDFIGHCTGMAIKGITRSNNKPRNLRRECIENLEKKALPVLSKRSENKV